MRWKIQVSALGIIVLKTSHTLNTFRSNEWVRNCGRSDLLSKDCVYLYKNCKLCANHFQEDCFSSCLNNRLFKNAIPMIFQNKQAQSESLMKLTQKVTYSICNNESKQINCSWIMKNIWSNLAILVYIFLAGETNNNTQITSNCETGEPLFKKGICYK